MYATPTIYTPVISNKKLICFLSVFSHVDNLNFLKWASEKRKKMC